MINPNLVQEPLSAGIVSIGDHFTDEERRVHLISNYWGLDSFLEAPIPQDELNVAFVTTASRPYPEFDQPARFLDAERAWLEERQAEGRLTYFEYCVAERNAEEVHEALKDASVIFMGGGNTQYLLEQLHTSGTDDVIRDLVRDGAWYLGKSAGAIVAGPDINPRGFLLRSMATQALGKTVGLGITEVYPLPHVDTPAIMDQVYDGKTGWQHAVEMTQTVPTAYILDNAHKKQVQSSK